MLKQLRQAAGLSAHRLSRYAYVTADTVVAYESGRCRPSMVVFCRIVDALGCQPGDLIPTGPRPGRLS